MTEYCPRHAQAGRRHRGFANALPALYGLGVDSTDVKEALRALPPNRPAIGIDLGSKSIGIAVSDITRRIATPRETIIRRKFSLDAQRLLEVAESVKAAIIVIGLPLNMDGSEGPRAQSTRAFARNLAKLTAIPIVFWDERLSTAAVERMLIDADASRARRAKIVDKLAAAYILQAALDSQ
jgi:putative holliday junction resolvase